MYSILHYRIKSEEEMKKEKRLETKIEEKDLEKPPDVKKQTMLIEIGKINKGFKQLLLYTTKKI